MAKGMNSPSFGAAAWAVAVASGLLAGVRSRAFIHHRGIHTGAGAGAVAVATRFKAGAADSSFRRGEVLKTNEDDLQRKVDTLVKAGKSQLRIVIDFDYTMTHFWVGGDRGYSCHRTIEECGLLPDAYHEKVRGLQEKYFPMEVSSEISVEEKRVAMIEWVQKAHDALRDAGFRKEYVPEAVRRTKMELRAGVAEFLSMLNDAGVPVLIFSAGIADVLEEVLRQRGQLYKNITIVSNKFSYNEDGTLRGFEAELAGREPFHVMNKSFTHVDPAVRKRLVEEWGNMSDDSTVLLVGDSTGDVSMSEGLLSEDVRSTRELKVGFLNFNISDRIDEYQNVYDVLILNDGDFGYINHIVRQIIGIPYH